MNRRRTILAIVVLIVAAIAIAIGRPIYRICSFDAAHARIAQGMSEAAVVDLMGSPDRVETSASVASWNDVQLGDDVPKRIVKQYAYTVNLPPVPISWTVGFDADGRVISKHRAD